MEKISSYSTVLEGKKALQSNLVQIQSINSSYRKTTTNNNN